MNTQQQLSDSLLAACKAAGIEEPKFIAQDKSGDVWHYDLKPDTNIPGIWTGDGTKIHHPPYADDWQDSLMEWVEPQNVESTLVSLPKEEEVAKIWDGFVNAKITELSQESIPWDTAYKISKPQGEPPANVLARHPDHVADTSKMIDMQDAIADAYRKHVGRCGLQTYAQTYRQGWQDALALQDGSNQPSGIEALVCDDIAKRQQVGIAKYGTTVAGNPLTHAQWLQHAYEECLDMAVYLKRAMAEKGGEEL